MNREHWNERRCTVNDEMLATPQASEEVFQTTEVGPAAHLAIRLLHGRRYKKPTKEHFA